MKRFLTKILAFTIAIATVVSVFSGCGQTKEEKYVYSGPNDVQYMTFVITNKHWMSLEPYLIRMKELHPDNKADAKRMYAFGTPGPMLITQSVEEIRDQVNGSFELAKQYDIPVFFQLDDVTNYTANFGNGAAIKFYEHPEMCEWTQFPVEGESYGGESAYGRVPHWYFNWGTEMKTDAFPNIASPAFRAFLKSQLEEGFIKPLIENLKELQKEGKEYLFAGCNIGWETQIPDYSSDSIIGANLAMPEDWERAQYGYGALHSLGYDQKRLIKEADEADMLVDDYVKELLYGVMHDFIEFIAKTIYDAGIPRHLIYSHQVSLGSSLKRYDTMVPPLWVAVNDYCTPGWTMSKITCQWDQQELESTIAKYAPGLNEYVNAEGYCSGYRDEASATEYIEQLLGGNCRNVTVFGYDNDKGTYGFKREPDFGFVVATNKWLNYEICPDFDWNKRAEFKI